MFGKIVDSIMNFIELPMWLTGESKNKSTRQLGIVLIVPWLCIVFVLIVPIALILSIASIGMLIEDA